MIPRTLLSVGASLSAVFVLLYFFRRKKNTPAINDKSTKVSHNETSQKNIVKTQHNGHNNIKDSQNNIKQNSNSNVNQPLTDIPKQTIAAVPDTETVLQPLNMSKAKEVTNQEQPKVTVLDTPTSSIQDSCVEKPGSEQEVAIAVERKETSLDMNVVASLGQERSDDVTSEKQTDGAASLEQERSDDVTNEKQTDGAAEQSNEVGSEISVIAKLCNEHQEVQMSSAKTDEMVETAHVQMNVLSSDLHQDTSENVQINVNENSSITSEIELLESSEKAEMLETLVKDDKICQGGEKTESSLNGHDNVDKVKDDEMGQDSEKTASNVNGHDNVDKCKISKNCAVPEQITSGAENLSVQSILPVSNLNDKNEIVKEADNENSVMSADDSHKQQQNGLSDFLKYAEINANVGELDNAKKFVPSADAPVYEYHPLDNAAVKPVKDTKVKIYYDNHRIDPNDMGMSEFDCCKMWPQTDDNKVFVQGSKGQPLVPDYLRDPEYLTNRDIPKHDPATSAFLYTNMTKLEFPANQWIRVISVSNSLELRVRHDQRDMLMQEMESKGICKPKDRPPQHHKIKVGSLVAAQLDVPKRGMIWCRVHVTEVVEGVAGDKKKGSVTPPTRFKVESIDYYPVASAKPLPVSQLRSLSQQAFKAPFYDQLYYLTNIMPSDKSKYTAGVRQKLLNIIRQGNNFLQLNFSAKVKISGVQYWFADLVSCAPTKSIEVGLELKRQCLAMHVFDGVISPETMFNLCMFKDGEAYWAEDERSPTVSKSSWGPDVVNQEFVFMFVLDNPRTSMCFSGFKLPFKHVKDCFKVKGFNVTFSEFLKLYQKQRENISTVRQEVISLMNQARLCVNIEFDYNTMNYFYKSTKELQEINPEIHLALQPAGEAIGCSLRFAKDENGFFFVDTEVGAFRRASELRKPVQ